MTGDSVSRLWTFLVRNYHPIRWESHFRLDLGEILVNSLLVSLVFNDLSDGLVLGYQYFLCIVRVFLSL